MLLLLVSASHVAAANLQLLIRYCRNFVDEIDPATNKTYCEGMTYGGMTPNQIQANGGTAWGPSYQLQVGVNIKCEQCSGASGA